MSDFHQALIVTALLFTVGTGCATSKAPRFDAGAGYQHFNYDQRVTFDEYVKDLSAILRDNWEYLSRYDDSFSGEKPYSVDKIVSWHTPVDQVPEKDCQGIGASKGMLLVHGLYDSPYVMKDLQAFFSRKCFHTRTLLLPGHGTRPGSLINIRREEWQKAMEYALQTFPLELRRNIYITGFSTGGALALKYVMEKRQCDQPEDVDIKGLFLFAPALKVEAGVARILSSTSWMKWVPYQRLADRDMVKYESITLNSVLQVAALAEDVRKKLHEGEVKLDIPVLLVVAENDYTIKSDTAIDLFRRGRFGDKSEMLIYSPLANSDGTCGEATLAGQLREESRQAMCESSNFVFTLKGREYYIADYSHMALTLKPDDEHYGLDGDYRYCTQYFFDADKKLRDLCMDEDNSQICFGERSFWGSQKYPYCKKNHRVVRRLTSNPRFDRLQAVMENFLQNLK